MFFIMQFRVIFALPSPLWCPLPWCPAELLQSPTPRSTTAKNYQYLAAKLSKSGGCHAPWHLSPWRNSPYSMEPQWSQNVGDM